MTEPLHDEAHLAAVLKTTKNWVVRHRHTLPHTRVGRYYRWSDDDIRAVIDSMRKRPETEGVMRPINGRRARRAS